MARTDLLGRYGFTLTALTLEITGLQGIILSRSLMHPFRLSGPETLPCGKPDEMVRCLDFFTTQDISQHPVAKIAPEEGQHRQPQLPYFPTDALCQTRSKAPSV